jgi:hypothetical protein
VVLLDGWVLAEALLTADRQRVLLAGHSLAVVQDPRSSPQVLRGLTSVAPGHPYQLITTRRIVDYARMQVRSAAKPYLGRLNNERVRRALRATLDTALAAMLQNEMLTGYLLDVTADRDMEKQGLVRVTMALQPTFSIEFIQVVMNLQ